MLVMKGNVVAAFTATSQPLIESFVLTDPKISFTRNFLSLLFLLHIRSWFCYGVNLGVN